MKTILVTGANGQLGQCIQDYVNENKSSTHRYVFLSRELFDLTKTEVLEAYFFSNPIEGVINCAAYTQVDLAEKEIEKAFQINADAVGLLAELCHEKQAKFLHVSTDYVFDGESTIPYKETDATNPLSVYGKSKHAGEQLALEKNPASIVVRTSWLYSDYGKNFFTTMLSLFEHKKELSIVSDQLGTPTNAHDLAKALVTIMESPTETKEGIYHYSNKGQCSWFDFAQEIKRISASEVVLHPIPTKDYPTPAKRPAFSLLDKDKIQTTFGLVIPQWKDSLANVYKRKQNA